MKGKIALIAVLTDDVPRMTAFYNQVLGFEIVKDLGDYVELKNEGCNFSLSHRSVMKNATGHASYDEPRRGQSFELAFPLESPEAVDAAYDEIIAKGATPVKQPSTMPWGMRTGFFADPDGNIHELFSY